MTDSDLEEMLSKIAKLITDALRPKLKALSNLNVPGMSQMSREQQVALIGSVMDANVEMFKTALDNAIPENFEEQVKEAMNGRK